MGDDDEHAIGTEARGIGEREVRHAVETHGRLAAAGAPLNRDDACGRARDELELLLIEHRRDGRQKLVLPHLAVGSDAQSTGFERRGSSTACNVMPRRLQPDVARLEPLPRRAVRLAHEDPLARADPHELPLRDGHASTREHLPLDLTSSELLVVVVPLLVAVEDAAHGGLPPVDDADARAAVDVRARPHEDVASLAALFQAQVAEIRALEINEADDALAALRADGADGVHLLEERGQVFGLGDGDLVTELEEARVVGGACDGGRIVGLVRGFEGALHRREEPDLFTHHARARFVLFEAGDGVVRGL